MDVGLLSGRRVERSQPSPEGGDFLLSEQCPAYVIECLSRVNVGVLSGCGPVDVRPPGTTPDASLRVEVSALCDAGPPGTTPDAS